MTTSQDLEQIVQQAHVAYQAALEVTPDTRAAWLQSVAAALDDHAEELVGIADRETHLGETRLQGELRRTTFQLRLFAEEVRSGRTLDATIDHADPAWGMGPRPDIRRVNVPIGVVAVFGASNFPFAFSVMGGDTASALAAGCAVVHKIHEAHEQLGVRTAAIVAQALDEADAPAGLFAALTSREAGQALIDHPLTKAVGFTGSTAVGRMLMDRAAARPEPIPFYGELGSVNPVFVTRRVWTGRSADIIAGYVASYTMGMGQFCTKPGLLFVPALGEEDQQAFRNAATETLPTPMLTPQLAERYHAARAEMAAREGVIDLVHGGTDEAPAPALLLTTTATVLQDPGILAEEMFGPASIVVQYEDEGDLVRLASAIPGQLTTTVHAEPEEDLSELVGILGSRSGRVIWNTWPTGVTVSYAQQHGGPYPATTAAGTTSVGTAAAQRFVRPVAYQDFPDAQLPPALQEANPWGLARRVDGKFVAGGIQ